ncbi:MAG: hypothetical protein JXM70_05400, partial [Pirellulales bacterium]|nr:hypothetical protein [Pirellulales bacterium]
MSRSLKVEPLEQRRLLAVLSPGDEIEPNDSPTDAQFLGSIPEITIEEFSVDAIFGDINDAFRYTPPETGNLAVRAKYDTSAPIGLSIFNSSGSSMYATGVTSPLGAGIEQSEFVIPVVAQTDYLILISDISPGVASVYNLEIENLTAPSPQGIDLAQASDTGMAADDNVTNDTTPTIFIQADLDQFEAAYTLPSGVGSIDSNGAPGADVTVYAESQTTGTVIPSSNAMRVPGTDHMWSVTLPVLADDTYLISAAVDIFDPGGLAGSSLLSEPIAVTIDHTAPAAPAAADMLASSDTFDNVAGSFGPVWSNSDDVTAINQPAFTGVAEANTKVRVYANGLLVGE